MMIQLACAGLETNVCLSRQLYQQVMASIDPGSYSY